MWIRNKRFSIETVVHRIYEVGDDIIGIKCYPSPNEIKEFYYGTSCAYYFKHGQNDDFYLKKNHLHYNIFEDLLKPGTPLKLKYDIVLCKHFNEENDVDNNDKNDDNDDNSHYYNTNKTYIPKGVDNIYKSYKLKKKNKKKRIYDNYIIDIDICPVHKDVIGVLNIVKYDDEYYEVDPDEYFVGRFLIPGDEVHLFMIGNVYTIYYKKTNFPSNYYLITKVIEG
jgi:hypothetical protein